MGKIKTYRFIYALLLTLMLPNNCGKAQIGAKILQSKFTQFGGRVRVRTPAVLL